jgi:hypothetical protein
MSSAPTKTIGAPITAQSAFPLMNEPPITPMPWKNHTPPTRTSTAPMTTRTMVTSSDDCTAGAGVGI